ncbi:hypothetical protein NDU88_005825 [Pleurodeles waltl]|uniref:Uncharacterized protein n=1 Tax=Pleurodeles waltl TaxID=8319 RepID=A0AAV7WVS7_PLEWA|nr:hypothetical protein NDU88_005825 [Pleurodeles waltl]
MTLFSLPSASLPTADKQAFALPSRVRFRAESRGAAWSSVCRARGTLKPRYQHTAPRSTPERKMTASADSCNFF